MAQFAGAVEAGGGRADVAVNGSGLAALDQSGAPLAKVVARCALELHVGDRVLVNRRFEYSLGGLCPTGPPVAPKAIEVALWCPPYSAALNCSDPRASNLSKPRFCPLFRT